MNIVFDFGAVLFTWQPAELLSGKHPTWVQQHGDAKALAQAIFHHPDWEAFDRGTSEQREVVAKTAQRLSLPHDDLHQLGLTVDPHRILRRTFRRFLMVDEEARQHEQARHPEDHEDKVAGLQPKIDHRQYLLHELRFRAACLDAPPLSWRDMTSLQGPRKGSFTATSPARFSAIARHGQSG